MAIRTAICDLLAIEVPIGSAGMAGRAGSAAAAAGAGAAAGVGTRPPAHGSGLPEVAEAEIVLDQASARAKSP
jgi:NAD(P)H-dependent flavin oxidoreductase YrpB (nitropropane dioxygenase family)